MKTINVTFEEEEHKNLLKVKGRLTWKKFIQSKGDGKKWIK